MIFAYGQGREAQMNSLENSRWMPGWPLLAGLLGLLLLAGCARDNPEPPSRNLFYEVQMASPADGDTDAAPAMISAEAAPVELSGDEVLSQSLEAEWTINWNCMSGRCRHEQCVGTARSRVRDVIRERWLEIDRRINWNEGCGRRTSWLSQVDRYTGVERYPSQEDRLFNFWGGSQAGLAERTIELSSGRQVDVWCTGPQQAQIDEGDGWATLFDGEVCYDVNTGMLVFMSYIKRWVFTGVFEGETYERAYFGDSETYEQLLTDTNAALSWAVEESK